MVIQRNPYTMAWNLRACKRQPIYLTKIRVKYAQTTGTPQAHLQLWNNILRCLFVCQTNECDKRRTEVSSNLGLHDSFV